ncbi:hypothetical protein [Streptomyces sp. NPDC093149]|uniref:hypothetical protein n=1 Tax=Streptomyces sp. NPDC093149 TaxID=3366031 RepID=UPI00380DFACB
MPTAHACCGMHGGATRRVVATVAAPGAAASDVGMLTSATNGGSGLRGTVEFSGRRLS